MATMHVSVDFESYPEFRMLSSLLSAHAQSKVAHIASAMAHFLHNRLWVELSYQASVTSRPGYLNSKAVTLFQNSVGMYFGDDCPPVEILKQSGWLKVQNGVESEELYCERFARECAHLAGNYTSREVKGAVASALERNKKHIAREATAQGMLLPPEVFKKRDGTKLNDVEINRAMVVIKTLDNCMKASSRPKGAYTEGLIADAAAVVDKYSAEALREFYVWLTINREKPLVPRTSEQVLARFDEVKAIMS
jgi:hypothetical protein